MSLDSNDISHLNFECDVLGIGTQEYVDTHSRAAMPGRTVEVQTYRGTANRADNIVNLGSAESARPQDIRAMIGKRVMVACPDLRDLLVVDVISAPCQQTPGKIIVRDLTRRSTSRPFRQVGAGDQPLPFGTQHPLRVVHRGLVKSHIAISMIGQPDDDVERLLKLMDDQQRAEFQLAMDVANAIGAVKLG